MHSQHRDDLLEDDASFEVDLDETKPDEIDLYGRGNGHAHRRDGLDDSSEVMWVKGHDRARYAFV